MPAIAIVRRVSVASLVVGPMPDELVRPELIVIVRVVRVARAEGGQKSGLELG